MAKIIGIYNYNQPKVVQACSILLTAALSSASLRVCLFDREKVLRETWSAILNEFKVEPTVSLTATISVYISRGLNAYKHIRQLLHCEDYILLPIYRDIRTYNLSSVLDEVMIPMAPHKQDHAALIKNCKHVYDLKNNANPGLVMSKLFSFDFDRYSNAYKDLCANNLAEQQINATLDQELLHYTNLNGLTALKESRFTALLHNIAGEILKNSYEH